VIGPRCSRGSLLLAMRCDFALNVDRAPDGIPGPVFRGKPGRNTRRVVTGLAVVAWLLVFAPTALAVRPDANRDGSAGPLGQWPQFVPLGFITAPHPDNPQQQTHLYGDWGGIVGEEFVFLQDGRIKLLYHSYHESYLTQRIHESELLDDWALGYDAVTKIKFPPLVKTGGPNPGPAWEHTDTPGYLRHPLTGEHLIYNTVRPGTRQQRPEWDGLPGAEGAIQVATSTRPPTIGRPFDQTYENALEAELWWERGWNNDGAVRGGLSEPTPVWAPHLGSEGQVRLFYRGLLGSSGSWWNWRISYADSDDGKTAWVKHGTPTFDPSDPANPAYKWTQPPPMGFSFRGAWQAHCTGDTIADGVHMVLTVSNQNHAGGGRIAYYWSPDWGDTWFGHPDNPIINPGTHPDGVPAAGFQRTPTLLIDDEYGRYVLAYNAGLDADVPWQRRTFLAVAERPAAHPTGVDRDQAPGVALRIDAIGPNPSHGPAQIDLVLAAPGRLSVAIYGLDGRCVTQIAGATYPAGPRTLVWNGRAAGGEPVASGVYFVRAALATEGRPVAVTLGRVVVLR
jgi:hypothetical protein